MYGFIYITTNLINNMKYIGQHTGFKTNYLGSGTLLKAAIRKYGRENFSREIIAYANTQKELDQLEQYYIQKYNAVASSMYYNIIPGGPGTGSGSSNPMFGKKHSESTKVKIRNKRIENNHIYQTDAIKKKLSIASKGENNPMFGKQHTEEAKKKMSINSQGKSNKEKNGMYGKKGELAINGKAVYQYADYNKTILIHKFVSVRETLKYLDLVGHVGLYKAIRYNLLYHGYYWDKEKKM